MQKVLASPVLRPRPSVSARGKLPGRGRWRVWRPWVVGMVATACGGTGREGSPGGPQAAVVADRTEDTLPCDAAFATLGRVVAGTPERRTRPGGCGVQVEAPRVAGVDPRVELRDAYSGWTDVPALAAEGPAGSRFTVEQQGVQCTATFAWGPTGPDGGGPWTVRVECSRRPGGAATAGHGGHGSAPQRVD